jgi:hypothetical protein
MTEKIDLSVHLTPTGVMHGIRNLPPTADLGFIPNTLSMTGQEN